jgi:UDP-glucose 4-epimerase
VRERLVADNDSRVLITGATGAVGPAVVARAVAAGLHVRILTRSASAAAAAGSAVETCVGDVRDDAVLARAVKGVDVVFHLAGQLHVTDAAGQRVAPYEEVNAAPTRALAGHAAAAGVRRVVLFSTIAVYGKGRTAVLDEDSPAHPDSRYGESKLRAEEALLAQRRPDGEPLGVVLRLAAVYGRRVKGNYRTMLEHLARGRPLPLLPGSNRRTLVYDEDVAAAAMLVSGDPRAAGRVFNVTDGATHTLREITDAMCQALGRSRPRLGVPAGIAAALVRIVRPALPGRLADMATSVEKFVESVAVDGRRLQGELGYVPGVGLVEGWTHTVAALRESGDIA